MKFFEKKSGVSCGIYGVKASIIENRFLGKLMIGFSQIRLSPQFSMCCSQKQGILLFQKAAPSKNIAFRGNDIAFPHLLGEKVAEICPGAFSPGTVCWQDKRVGPTL